MAPMTIQERLRMYHSINIKPFYLEIADHIDALEARIKELEQDAARYQWLRNTPGASGVFMALYYNNSGEEMDAALDAEIAAMKDQS